MRSQRITQVGAGQSAVLAVDYIPTRQQLGLGTKVSGSATYTIEHTFDNVLDESFSAAAATWYNNPNSGLVNATGNVSAEMTLPVKGIRINQSTGTGSTTLTMQQGIQG